MASRASTRTAPSATSAFSRSAVPNAIDGDTSSTSQVVTSRSGTSSAHVRLARARGGRGVEPAHVVAGLVGAQRRQLGARAHARSAMLARERAAGAASERQVERLDEARGQGPRPLAAGRRREQRRARHAASPSVGRIGWVSASGAWAAASGSTAAITCSSTWSPVTPSLSAS